jgi:hypothetical protein
VVRIVTDKTQATAERAYADEVVAGFELGRDGGSLPEDKHVASTFAHGWRLGRSDWKAAQRKAAYQERSA